MLTRDSLEIKLSQSLGQLASVRSRLLDKLVIHDYLVALAIGGPI